MAFEILVPQWAKSAIWYQIFPERFCNGDTSNDPTLDSIAGSWPDERTSPWQVHPWTSDWYELQPYEKKNTLDLWGNILRRRYGGDIQGIINKLDYLQDLGITALYLNPVFQSPSLHKYDGVTYHHIDPHFGPDPIGDKQLITQEVPHDPQTWVWTKADKLFLELVSKVHDRGMHIIIDGVFNHMGHMSWPFQDVLKKQEKSLYKDWFIVDSWDNADIDTKFSYKGWYGYSELPELGRNSNGTFKSGIQKYIFDCTRRWMSPEGNSKDGIDGWRLDVAFCVPHPFWKEWRKLVKSINSETYLVAEIIDSPYEELLAYLRGDELDAVMNYNFAFLASEFFIDRKERLSVSQFDQKLREHREAFHPETTAVMQNLYNSHDSHRFASHIVNPDVAKYRDWEKEFHKKTQPRNNPSYQVRKPNEYERQIQKLMLVFQMTYVGAPMVYYGDEAGMWGGNDPCCRKPMVWPEFQYSDEIYLPDGTKRQNADTVEFDQDMFNFYKKLIYIRNQHSSLQLGDFSTLLLNDIAHLYAFTRTHQNQVVHTVLNNSDQIQQADLPIPYSCVDLLQQAEYSPDKGKLCMTFCPFGSAILIKK